MKEQLKEAYIKHCLEEQKVPLNVYLFAQSLELEENDFYSFYASLEVLEMDIFNTFFNEVRVQIEQTEVYASYSAREKILCFNFALIEALKSNRSFFKMLLDRKQSMFAITTTPVFFKQFKVSFIEFAKQILSEGMASKEIEERMFLSTKYSDALWLNELYIMNFFSNDHSEGFEKTDVAIEKSVNLSFDLMAKTPLDSLFDFGKFMIQNR